MITGAARKFRQQNSMSTEETTGWECRFCFEQLKRCPCVGWQRLLWLVPVRPHRCPHCFNTFQKPVGVLANLPFVKQIFCEKRGVSAKLRRTMANVAVRKTSRRRNYANPNWMVRFTRWSCKIETKALESFKDIFHRIWMLLLWLIYWLSRKTGISNRSLLSSRSKPRRRSRSRSRDERVRNNHRDSEMKSSTDSDGHL